MITGAPGRSLRVGQGRPQGERRVKEAEDSADDCKGRDKQGTIESSAHDRFIRNRFAEVPVPAEVVPLDGKQEPDDEHIRMKEDGGIRDDRVVSRKIGRERHKDDGYQNQDVDL
jgi:hypothetical protein